MCCIFYSTEFTIKSWPVLLLLWALIKIQSQHNPQPPHSSGWQSEASWVVLFLLKTTRQIWAR